MRAPLSIWSEKISPKIAIGIVQGLTEFLPVSSTAHLRIVPAFVGWDDPGAAFTAVVQLGTMAAVLATLLAFVVGYASIAFLLRYLARHSTAVFTAYRVVIGALVLALTAAGAIS